MHLSPLLWHNLYNINEEVFSSRIKSSSCSSSRRIDDGDVDSSGNIDGNGISWVLFFMMLVAAEPTSVFLCLNAASLFSYEPQVEHILTIKLSLLGCQ